MRKKYQLTNNVLTLIAIAFIMHRHKGKKSGLEVEGGQKEKEDKGRGIRVTRKVGGDKSRELECQKSSKS